MSPPLALLIAGAAILLCFVVPGLTWGPLLAPGRMDDLGRLARATGAGVVVAAVVATGLVAVGMLQPGVALLSLLAVTAIPLASGPVRADLVDTLRTRRRRATLGLLVIALVAVGIQLALSHARLGPETLPATSTVWYYRHLAELVESTGGLPAQFPEWGGPRPFHTDYLPFTAHSALVFSLMGLDRVGGLEAYRLATLAATTLLALLLFRRWMPTWIALVGALLFVTTLRMDWKLLSYKPETFGLLIGLFTLWLLDRAAVERSWRLAASGALGFGLVVMSHAEIAIVLLPAVVAIGLARGVARPGGGRVGLRLRPGRRAIERTLVPIVATAVGMVGGLVVNAALTGEAGLLGYVTARPAAESPAAVSVTEAFLPDGWELSDDPTWNFHTAAVARGQAGDDPPVGFTDRRLLSRENLHVWPAIDARELLGAAALAALLLLPLLAWPRLDARRRGFVVFVAIFALGLLAGAFILNEISATYVPRRIGARRLVPYELLVPVGFAMLALFVGARGLRGLADRRGLSRTARRGASIAGLAILLAILLVPSAAGADDEESGGLSPAGAAAYAWLDENLPEDARILANAYTDGSLSLLSGRLGVLDGRAVYLEDPVFVSEATDLLLGARRFFADPSNPASDQYLALADPDYLLVATTQSGVDLGGYRPFVTDVDALDADPRFTFVRDLADGNLRLYRVATGGGSD